jgi:hypothetical protein
VSGISQNWREELLFSLSISYKCVGADSSGRGTTDVVFGTSSISIPRGGSKSVSELRAGADVCGGIAEAELDARVLPPSSGLCSSSTFETGAALAMAFNILLF